MTSPDRRLASDSQRGQPPWTLRMLTPWAISAVAAVALVAPSVLQQNRTEPVTPPGVPTQPTTTDARAQIETPVPTAHSLPALRANPLVLTYHDVSPDAVGDYNVTPERFARDIASLRDAGWETVRTSRYLAWLNDGTPLPPRSLLLTFDDATAGAWIYADPILRHAGYRAIAFVTTGFVEEGDYYLTWPELQAMHSSERWDIEAHADLGHQLVVADADGTTAPYLQNRIWLGNSLEPLAAFESRVAGDVERSRSLLRARGFDPRIFAYPFASDRVPSNDPEAAAFTRARVRDLFGAAMTENVLVHPVGASSRYEIPRLGVTAPIELADLFADQILA